MRAVRLSLFLNAATMAHATMGFVRGQITVGGTPPTGTCESPPEFAQVNCRKLPARLD